MEASKIIATMERHIQENIEKPSPIFGNMPVCPFAKKARLGKIIKFAVYPFLAPELIKGDPILLDLINEFLTSQAYEVLMVIHPRTDAISLLEMKETIQVLNDLIQPMELKAFSGHPLDDFNIGGAFTRRDPYINFVLQRKTAVMEAANVLKKTPYYNNWSKENLSAVNLWDS